MEFEKNKLKETVEWINKQSNLAEEKQEELEKKVSMLKKSSGGTYSEELALTSRYMSLQIKIYKSTVKQLTNRILQELILLSAEGIKKAII